MFTEIYSLMAIMLVPAMLFNHYFTMKTNNNLLMYRSSLQIFLSLFPDYSACETASQSNKNTHVLLNQLFKNVLNTFGIVASPFLNIISYLFDMYSNGIALEDQVTKSSGGLIKPTAPLGLSNINRGFHYSPCRDTWQRMKEKVGENLSLFI